MTREEWLDWRRLGLGGSDIATVMLDEPMWTSEWELWLSKVKGVDSGRSDAAMLTGQILEEAVIKWACAELNADRWVPGDTLIHPDHSWMRATTDAWLGGATIEGERCHSIGIEAKVAEWPWDEPPEDYVLQCRHYMACTNNDRWVLAAFFRKAPAWKLWIIKRSPTTEADMLYLAEKWWQLRVIDGVAPDIDGTRAAAVGLGTIHGAPEEKDAFRVASPEEERLVREYADVDATVKSLEQSRGLLGNRLRGAIAEDAGVRGTGFRCRWSRGEKQRAGRLIVRIDE